MTTNLFSLSILLATTILLSCQDHKENPADTLSLEAYTNLVNQVIVEDTARTQGFTTARESILNQAEGYRKQYEQLISAPAEVASAHTDFVNARYEQYQSNLDAGLNSQGLSASIENVNESAHYRADVGYARDDKSTLGCQLKSILSQSNLTLNGPGVCEAYGNSTRMPNKAAGRAQQPVHEVYMLHDVIREADGSIIRPNVDGFAINTIYARANQPLSITFDNRNPEPFVFSFSIYKSSDTRVKKSDFVGSTTPYSGVQEQKLTITLAAVPTPTSTMSILLPGEVR